MPSHPVKAYPVVLPTEIPLLIWSVLTPRQSQARESNVTTLEAKVTRHEAEILAGAPGGVVGPT